MPALIFIIGVGLVLSLMFRWRDTRVEEVLSSAQPGDVIEVGTDVCNVLKDRNLVASETDCGYRERVKVRIQGPTEE